MWSYIDKTDVESFINEYPQLAEGFAEISLYETEDRIFVPRLFYLNFPKYIKVFKGKDEPIFNPTYFKFTGKLRDGQVESVNTILDIYYKQKSVNGIAKCPPGFGKTVISTFIASKIGLKTCIVIDVENLLNQWIESFMTFTDLKAEDIGLIKGKHFIIDRPVVIASVQTLLSKVRTDMHKHFQLFDEAKFGLVFFDEVHNTSSASKYSKASLMFRTKNIIGLSATPFQNGTAEILMRNTVGPNIYETKQYDSKPIYILNYYDSGLTSKYAYVIGRMSDYIKRKAFYNSIIIKSPAYLNIILNLVKKRLAEERVVLILVFTKAQVKLISDGLTNENIEHRRFYGDEKDAIDKVNTKVLIGTYAFIGKGFDFALLSSLILGTNLAGKKSLIQVIGRILRSSDNKLQPIVDDLIDTRFPSLFLPDIKAKKSIVTAEFNCEIRDVRDEQIIETGNEII